MVLGVLYKEASETSPTNTAFAAICISELRRHIHGKPHIVQKEQSHACYRRDCQRWSQEILSSLECLDHAPEPRAGGCHQRSNSSI